MQAEHEIGHEKETKTDVQQRKVFQKPAKREKEAAWLLPTQQEPRFGEERTPSASQRKEPQGQQKFEHKASFARHRFDPSAMQVSVDVYKMYTSKVDMCASVKTDYLLMWAPRPTNL